MPKRSVRSVQIDEAGHRRVEELAKLVGLTQEAAASVLVKAARDEHVRELLTEAAGLVVRDRHPGSEPAGG